MNARPLTIMLIAGEPSGDVLGAQLMAGLKALAGDNIRIIGVGGAAMTAQGLRSLFPLDATAVMGLREVVPRIPAILRRVRQASDYALAERPDVVVCIDSPDFTHRIARRIKRFAPEIRTVNYVAPQVWASRQYRAKKMARYFDLVLALFPFEAPFFEAHGLHAKFAGHPVIERAAWMTGGDALRARLGIAPDAPLLCVLPGSRASEVRFLLPPFRAAVARIAKEIPGLVCVLPTVPNVSARVREGAKDWPTPLHILEGDADKYAAFEAADAALAASGTVTTEVALAKTPMVVAYKLGWLTYALMRPLISAKFATLVNILLDREAVPEFIQEKCTPENLAAAVVPLFRNPAVRARQVADLEEATADLGRGEEAPSLRAARVLLDFAITH
ncbi:MAG TPA: lipid-A-disaccharide synthase [Rhizomicrobium sp.]|jgi:lipid-A-disaccharide synthase|nr:lipid-A-disaccharide synthase [Rhizomicrobium sp.]